MIPDTKYVIVVKKLDAPNSLAVNTVFQQVQRWAASYVEVVLMVADGGELTPMQLSTIGDSTPLVVAIGGDGTVIMAAKIAMQFKFAPIAGFNLGKVGFLVDYDPKSVFESLNAAMDGDFKEDYREMLEVWVDDKLVGIGLNDVVVSCKDSDTSFQYDLGVKNAFAGTHLANGVIFSTPTGSTAYAIAVGGAIMMPDLENVMQIVPIAAQTLASRPLIVKASPGAELSFYAAQGRPITVRVDGQIVSTIYPNDPQDVPQTLHRLRVVKHERKAVLFHHKNWNHFETLTQKLGWNK